ncbi:MAG TPA: alcohol dehydrogenase catalytic domain-containing protein [Streptosporangiaceae bacterium]|nr:alcohol dehydrogenase catalytic domain-containing protein [Streptosporangiaceae bacterium]
MTDPAGGHQALTVVEPGEVRLLSRAALHPGPGELLVEPELVGLCGTDLEIIDGTLDPAYLRYPLVLGHEWTGIVADGHPMAGRRVVVEGMVGCGRCVKCAAGQVNLCESYDEIGFTRDGAAAGQILVPRSLAHPLDDGVGAADAVLAEPAAVVYQALSKVSLTPGSRVLVLGDGTIALLAVLLARLWSPALVDMVGMRSSQAALAAAAGASSFGLADSQADDPAPGAAPSGFDVVVEAAGSADAVLTAVSRVRRGGTVLLIGLPPHGETAALAIDDLVNNDLTMLGSFSYTPAAWRGVLALLNSGQLRPAFLVTHRYRLAEWERAVARLRGQGCDGGAVGPQQRGKVLLEVQ